jgi:hypothetical protein
MKQTLLLLVIMTTILLFQGQTCTPQFAPNQSEWGNETQTDASTMALGSRQACGEGLKKCPIGYYCGNGEPGQEGEKYCRKTFNYTPH